MTKVTRVPHRMSVEAVLGVVLLVCLATHGLPIFADGFKARAVADVRQKLAALGRAKHDYLVAHPVAIDEPQTVALVPKYLDRWPCSYVGRCSEFAAGLPGEAPTLRGVTLDELEDPVSHLDAVARLIGDLRDALGK